MSAFSSTLIPYFIYSKLAPLNLMRLSLSKCVLLDNYILFVCCCYTRRTVIFVEVVGGFILSQHERKFSFFLIVLYVCVSVSVKCLPNKPFIKQSFLFTSVRCSQLSARLQSILWIWQKWWLKQKFSLLYSHA